MSLELQVLVFYIPGVSIFLFLQWFKFVARMFEWQGREQRREIFKMQKTRDVIRAWRWNSTPVVED